MEMQTRTPNMSFIIRKITTFTHSTRIEAGMPQKRTLDGFVCERDAKTFEYETADDARASMLALPLSAPENDAGYSASFSYAVYDKFDVSRGDGIRPTLFMLGPVHVRNWK
jgi:hypothetical protein